MINKFSEEILGEFSFLLKNFSEIEDLNSYINNKAGIIDFFKSQKDYKDFKQLLDGFHNLNNSSQDLGDFQTPKSLTERICKFLVNLKFEPEAMIEPTCGEGSFVLSAIKFFPTLKHIYCVDVQKKYEWLLKLNILQLSFNQKIQANIEFHQDNIFTHQISDRFIELLNNSIGDILILGNPPWVTSSALSILDSDNLPYKSNIKKYSGIQAITGKSNFDIAEYIILKTIKQFDNRNGKIAMLCKTSVIKNIVKEIDRLSLKISNIRSLLIDSKKEFNISADAALFIADLNSRGKTLCTTSSLYQPDIQLKKYGWIQDKFVSDEELYKKYSYMDGKSTIEWRQGVKHDASKVMILNIIDNALLNGFQEYVEIEDDCLYPFVKGSELRKLIIKDTTKKIIITQKSPNDNTNYIMYRYPRLWDYLNSHSEYFDKRKSRIYNKRSRFSIFGIGNYSFMPYKVAISGFYKEASFSLMFPNNNKAVMLDDTCYFLSFNSIKNAFFSWILLNTNDVKHFLSSIAFLDSKRPYTKEILMRINILQLAENISFHKLLKIYQTQLKKHLLFEFNEDDFLNFKDFLKDSNSAFRKQGKLALELI